MNEIQNNYSKQIEEKMKKIQQSTEIIKEIEEKRRCDIENRKFERYENKFENLSKFKTELKEKKDKDKRRFDDVRDNFQEIQKKFERKNKELSNRLKKKINVRLSNDALNTSNNNIDSYLSKRQDSMKRFSVNSTNIKRDNALKNIRYLELQSERNIRSIDKIKTIDMSREFVRY